MIRILILFLFLFLPFQVTANERNAELTAEYKFWKSSYFKLCVWDIKNNDYILFRNTEETLQNGAVVETKWYSSGGDFIYVITSFFEPNSLQVSCELWRDTPK